MKLAGQVSTPLVCEAIMMMSKKEQEEMINKFTGLPSNKVDAFGFDRGIVKGHPGVEGGSYRAASIRRQ